LHIEITLTAVQWRGWRKTFNTENGRTEHTKKSDWENNHFSDKHIQG